MDNSTGIVAILDILGYKSFLENNDAGEAVAEVLDVLNNAKSNTRNMAFAPLAKTEDSKKEMERIFENIQWLVFADTILLARAYPQETNKENKLECWGSVCYAARFLYSHLFAWDLPVRGAVAFGQFLIKEHCFAGYAIAEARKCLETLDLAALALAASAEEEFLNFGTSEPEVWRKNKYVLPLKDGNVRESIVLPPSCSVQSLFSKHQGVRSGVLNAFLGHNKYISPKEMPKVNNTEIFLQWCLNVAS